MAKKKKKYRYPGVRPGRKPNTYRIEYYDWDGTRRTKIFHGSESDAAKFRRAIIVKVDRIKHGIEPPPEKKKHPSTLLNLWEDFYGDFLIRVESGSRNIKTLNRYRNSLEAFVDYSPELSNKLLSKISWRDFEGFKIYRKASGYSPVGVNTELRNLKGIFNFGVKKGFIRRSPLQEVEYIRVRKHDVRYLNEDEMIRLQDVLESLDLTDEYQKDAHDLVIFYLYTAARASEGLYPHFNWNCIEPYKVYFPKTKTYTERTIPLTERVNDVLESRKYISSGPFNFDIYQVYKRTGLVFRKAGLKDVSTHTLRKTAGAYYYLATRDIFATSRFLGHSSVKVTESHYVGLIQSLQTEYSKQFDSTLTNALEGRTLMVRHFGTNKD